MNGEREKNGYLEEIRYFFKQFFMFLVGDIFLIGLVIDGEQVNGCSGNFQVRDHSKAARFSFAFGSDGHAYFEAVVAQGSSLCGFFLQAYQQLCKIVLEGLEFFRQLLISRLKLGIAITKNHVSA